MKKKHEFNKIQNVSEREKKRLVPMYSNDLRCNGSLYCTWVYHREQNVSWSLCSVCDCTLLEMLQYIHFPLPQHCICILHICLAWPIPSDITRRIRRIKGLLWSKTVKIGHIQHYIPAAWMWWNKMSLHELILALWLDNHCVESYDWKAKWFWVMNLAHQKLLEINRKQTGTPCQTSAIT